MDEVIFRSSQKFEDLQFHLGQAASDGKRAIYSVSLQAKDAVVSLLHKPSTAQVIDNFKHAWLALVQYAKELNETILKEVNMSRIYESVNKLLNRQLLGRDTYFCVFGLVVGGYIGYVIGKSVSKSYPPVYYMRAIQCTNYSGIESVSVAEDAVAKHECGKNEVLITVKAASVQVIDAQVCSGYGKTIRSLLAKYTSCSRHDLPFTLGRDCTGIITDIGQNVKRLEIGDEVWVSVPFWYPGTLSQMFIVSECKVGQKPKKIGFESACSLPYAGTVALEALEEVSVNIDNAVNKRVFINHGCTPIGCVLIQILKLWKAHITTTCFKRALPVAKALGANDIIILPDLEAENHNQNIGDVLQKEMELREKFDVIISTKEMDINFHDFCNTEWIISTFPRPLKSDSFGGLMKAIFGMYVHCKCITQRLFGYEIGNFGETHACFQTLDMLKKFVENDQLQTVVDKVFHPHDIEGALYHIQSPASIGSTVITFR